MAKQPQILVVEDNPQVLRSVSRLLRKAGYHVCETWTGREAIRLLQESHVDLVVLDAVLPDLDGIEVCARIKADPDLATSYVLLLSAHRTSADRRAAALESGADGYVNWPLPGIEFMAHVRSLLRLRRAEEALRESEERHRRLVEVSPDGIVMTDLEGRILTCNRRMSEMYGFEGPEALIGRNTLELLVPEEWARALENIQGVFNTGSACSLGFTALRQDGSQFNIELSASLIRDRHGQPQAFMAVIRDITDRVRTEEALRMNEAKYRTLFETMMHGVVYQAADGRIIEANPAAQRILGMTLEELQGRTSVDPEWRAIREDGSDFPGEAHPSMVALRTGQEQRDVTMGVFNPRLGEHRWLRVSAVPQFRPGETQPYQVYTCFEDRTERRNAEVACRQAEARLDYVMRSSPVVIYAAEPWGDQATTFMCSNVLRVLGYKAREFEEDPRFWVEHIHPDDRPGVLAGLETLLEHGSHVQEYRFRHKDGTYRWLRDEANLVRDEAGWPIEIVGSWIDISGRVQAEEALRRERDILDTIMEHTGAHLAYLDPGFRFVRVNSAYVRGSGHTREELIGRNHFELFPDAENQTIFERVRDTGQVATFQAKPFVYADQPERGITYWDWTLAPVNDQGSPIQGFVFSLLDVTERKQAEQKIQASLREKEILLKEIHHRVKNNLQVISSLLDMQSLASFDPSVQQALQDSRDRVQAMAFVHERLYQAKDLGSIEVPDYVRTIVEYLFGVYAARSFHVSQTVHVDEVGLSLDAAVLCGLIINELVSNALKHAFPMPRESGDEIRVELRTAPDGKHCLIVADNGVGLPATVDPCDTQSVGLRLVTLLAQQLKGTIEVSRSPGTTFRIAFGGPRTTAREART